MAEWPGPEGVVIRTARQEDAETLARVLALNRASVEPALLSALEQDPVEGLLELDSARRRDAIIRAQVLSDAMDAFPGLSTLLVAEDEHDDVVGAAEMLVPGQVAMGLLRAGVHFADVAMVIATVTKLASLAVVKPARGRGVGAALVERARRIDMRAGFTLMYGQFHVGTGLERFSQRCGFDVLAEREPIALPPYIPFLIGPDPGESAVRPLAPNFRALALRGLRLMGAGRSARPADPFGSHTDGSAAVCGEPGVVA